MQYYYCYECSPGETYRPKQFHMTNKNLPYSVASSLHTVRCCSIDWIFIHACMDVWMSRINVGVCVFTCSSISCKFCILKIILAIHLNICISNLKFYRSYFSLKIIFPDCRLLNRNDGFDLLAQIRTQNFYRNQLKTLAHSQTQTHTHTYTHLHTFKYILV